MAKFLPFKAILPSADKAHLVASRSYVSYSPDALKQKLTHNPYSYIHIINPDFEKEEKVKPRTEEYFKLIKNKFEEFLACDILQKQNEPAFYLYRKIRDGKTFLGWIGLVSTEDYKNHVIKKHENTLSKRVNLFKDYLTICDFHAEPVLMIHEQQEEIASTRDELQNEKPLFDFSTVDEARHTLWQLIDSSKIEHLKNAFGKLGALYIADGHHRTASSALLSEDSKNPKNSKNYFLAYCIEEKYLNIQPYHRYVQLDTTLNVEALMASIVKYFTIKKLSLDTYLPDKGHNFGMYLNGIWYGLKYKVTELNDLACHQLDTYILNHYLLSPLFGIEDERTDHRIKFIAGENAIDKMIKRVDAHSNSLGFSLFPIKTDELKAVANANESMPPKSTWVLPKLRSGLVIYSYSLNHD